jgi:hypothetical protein
MVLVLDLFGDSPGPRLRSPAVLFPTGRPMGNAMARGVVDAEGIE